MVLWLLLIFTLSSLPYLSPPGEITGRDKLAHLIVYAVLGHLAGNAGWERSRRGRAVTFAIAAGIGIGYGVFDELYQSLVPGRFMSLLDLAADAAGVLLGVTTSFLAARERGGEALPDAARAMAGARRAGHRLQEEPTV